MAVRNVSGTVSAPVTNGKKPDASGMVGSVKTSDNTGVVSAKDGDAAKNPLGVDVSVSNEAKSRSAERKKAFDIAKNTPDVREARVAELKAKIQSGEYKPDSGKIADGMLREAIMEHLAQEGDRQG